MAMKSALNQLLESIDHYIVAPLVRQHPLPSGHGYVTAFLFHRLFSSTDIPINVYPHERTTVDFFEAFVAACHRKGLQFITPQDILMGRHLGHHNVMLTFDDGYADNLLALPILENYNARATFFIAPAHIVENRRFWCDAVWSQGGRNLSHYQNLTHANAQAEIEARWPGVLYDPSPNDRPMRLCEFKQLAQSLHAEIGHHSYNHTILSPRTADFITNELNLANDFFKAHMGQSPKAIAYPNGVYCNTLINVCGQQEFRMGLTCEPRTELISATPQAAQLMRFGRYSVAGTRSHLSQIESALLPRSSKTAMYQLKRRLNRLKGRKDQAYNYGE